MATMTNLGLISDLLVKSDTLLFASTKVEDRFIRANMQVCAATMKKAAKVLVEQIPLDEIPELLSGKS